MLVIVLFILILNIVSIVLMYYCLSDLSKKEKLVYIAAGTALMYVITSIIYWISTRNIEVTQVSETGKDLITFLFVPINGLIVLPLFAKSYYKFRTGGLDIKILRNRGIVLLAILLIVLIIECFYFENIQEQVVNMLTEQQNALQENGTTDQSSDAISNALEDIENVNQVSNEVGQENLITVEETSNGISSVSNTQGDNTTSGKNEVDAENTTTGGDSLSNVSPANENVVVENIN